MESAPARAQSRIPPFRLSKTVQPAPHKGQRRWLPHFSGQSSSADAKKRRKKARLSKMPSQPARDKGCGTQCLDTHNAACGIDSKTALRVLSVTQSRFRMQKAHSNLDDAAHYRRTLIINTVNTTRNVKEALINSALPS